MNNIYLYKYKSNGIQFTSSANPQIMSIYTAQQFEQPTPIGVLRIKTIKNNGKSVL